MSDETPQPDDDAQDQAQPKPARSEGIRMARAYDVPEAGIRMRQHSLGDWEEFEEALGDTGLDPRAFAAANVARQAVDDALSAKDVEAWPDDRILAALAAMAKHDSMFELADGETMSFGTFRAMAERAMARQSAAMLGRLESASRAIQRMTAATDRLKNLRESPASETPKPEPTGPIVFYQPNYAAENVEVGRESLKVQEVTAKAVTAQQATIVDLHDQVVALKKEQRETNENLKAIRRSKVPVAGLLVGLLAFVVAIYAAWPRETGLPQPTVAPSAPVASMPPATQVPPSPTMLVTPSPTSSAASG